jgi:hypothetical protein
MYNKHQKKSVIKKKKSNNKLCKNKIMIDFIYSK